jgi:hypothetical protein
MQHSPPGELLGPQPVNEIHRNLCDLKVHYRVHNSPPLFPILSQTDLVHEPPNSIQPYSLKIHFTIYT